VKLEKYNSLLMWGSWLIAFAGPGTVQKVNDIIDKEVKPKFVGSSEEEDNGEDEEDEGKTSDAEDDA
jgi:hypothetical protein